MKRKWCVLDGEGRKWGGFAVLLMLLTLIGVQGAWADGFGVADNKIVITTNSGGPSYQPSIDAGGIASGVNQMTGTSLDTLALTVVSGVVDGIYTLNLGIVVDDAKNDRRIEAYLPGVKVAVSGTGTDVTLQSGQGLEIAGRSSDGETKFVTTMTNGTEDGPVTASGDILTFNFSNLQDKIEAKFGAVSGTADIINSFFKEGEFSYTVLIQSSVPMGYVGNNTITPFPAFDIGPDCNEYGKNLSQISGSPIANNSFLHGNSYAIRGSFGVGAGNYAPAPGDAPLPNGACVVTPPVVTPPVVTPPVVTPPVVTPPVVTPPVVTPPVVTPPVEPEPEPDDSPGDGTPVTADDVMTEPAGDAAANVLEDNSDEAAETFDSMFDVEGEDEAEVEAKKEEAAEKLADVLEAMTDLEGDDTDPDAGTKKASDIVQRMEADLAADTVEKMESDKAGDLLEGMLTNKAADIVEEMEVEQAADVVEQMDEAKAGAVLANAGADKTGDVLLDIVTNGFTDDQTQQEKKDAVRKNAALIGNTLAVALVSATDGAAGGGVTSLDSFLENESFMGAIKGSGATSISIGKVIKKESGLPPKVVKELTARIDEILKKMFGSTARSAIRALLRDARAGENISVVTDPETGKMDMRMDGFSYPASMVDIAVTGEAPAEDGVDQSARNGLALEFTQAEGLGGLNFTLVPTAADLAGLKTLLGEDATEIDTDNGFLILTGAAGEKYVGAFGWGAGNVSETPKTIESFEIVGTDPAAAEYRARLIYSDGSRQDLAPVIAEVDKLAAFLTANVENGGIESFLFDRNLGVLSIVRDGTLFLFKASYVVTQNAGEEPVLDEFGMNLVADSDVNGDNLPDVIITTIFGTQILYSLLP